MFLRTPNKHYDLKEVNYYKSNNNNSSIEVVELTVDCAIEDLTELESNPNMPTAIISTESQFMLSDYTLNEWFEEDDAVKIIYVK